MFSEGQELINKYMLEIWNRKNRNIIYELFSHDALIHSPMGESRGPQAMDDAVRQWHEAFPDIRIKLLQIFELGDKIAVHWNSKGTHKGHFLGLEPTLKPFICGGMSIYRIDDGKIAEYWAYINLHHLMQQLTSLEQNRKAHLAPI